MPDGQPGATLKPVKTTDVYRTHAAAGGAEQKHLSPGCRSSAGRRANSVVFYATGAIVGNAIAPSPSLATLPITLFVLGMAASILPFGALGRTRGRKAAFRLGTGAGMVTGLAAATAVVLNSFLLFCLAAMLGGAYAAVALSFRFAATDGVAPARRARALSLVMGGGVAAGIIGPMLVTGTMHLWPAHTFAVTFLAQALVAVLAAFC